MTMMITRHISSSSSSSSSSSIIIAVIITLSQLLTAVSAQNTREYCYRLLQCIASLQYTVYHHLNFTLLLV